VLRSRIFNCIVIAGGGHNRILTMRSGLTQGVLRMFRLCLGYARPPLRLEQWLLTPRIKPATVRWYIGVLQSGCFVNRRRYHSWVSDSRPGLWPTSLSWQNCGDSISARSSILLFEFRRKGELDSLLTPAWAAWMPSHDQPSFLILSTVTSSSVVHWTRFFWPEASTLLGVS
jgi:hypothetical protein